MIFVWCNIVVFFIDLIDKYICVFLFFMFKKFRSSTRRRQILDEQQSPGACNSQTPQSRSRNLLGRTPTKLYSPFGIESPRHAWDKENDSATLSDSSKKMSMIREPCRPFRFIKSRGFAALR